MQKNYLHSATDRRSFRSSLFKTTSLTSIRLVSQAHYYSAAKLTAYKSIVYERVYGCETWHLDNNDYHRLNLIWNRSNSFRKFLDVAGVKGFIVCSGLFKGQFTTAQVGGGRAPQARGSRRRGGGVHRERGLGRGLCRLPRKKWFWLSIWWVLVHSGWYFLQFS